MTGINIVNGCVAYDTIDGQTYILDINQALDFTETMENSLLCTNQARAHGVVIEEVPKFFDNNIRHYISFPEYSFYFLYSYMDLFSTYRFRYPTEEELTSCHHLE